MAKIEDVNIPFNFNPQVSKKKSKKLEKKAKGSSIFLKEPETFEEILYDTEIRLEAQEIEKQKTKLENLLKDIGNQGEKLKKSRVLIDLDIYKKLVKKYLSIAIMLSEKTEKKYLWDKFKKEKIAKTHFQIIDKELLELTRIFFTEQQNTFAIAAKIDKIEGLLIDLKS